MWAKGESNGMKYEVKHYDQGSEWGIDGGRISKLYIGKGGITLCAYERGWDIHPKTEAAKKLYEALVKEYN
ncbi:MAG TPA: hypothetical protein OIL76_06230 [Veillonellaceae bacterium]|nr:hypothetical protein [Veillonellaceae bacterium]